MLVSDTQLSPEFSNFRCYIGFVSHHVTFCEYSKEVLRFCFVPSIEDLRNCEGSLQLHSEYLVKVSTYAKRFLKSTPIKSVPLNELFKYLNDTGLLETFHDIVYIFSGEIVNVEYDCDVRLHLIHHSSEPNEKNIQFAMKSKATYSVETEMNENTLKTLKSCLTPKMKLKGMKVFTSNTVYVKSVYGPIKRSIVEKHQTKIDLKFFSRSIPPFFILRNTKNQSDSVSVQMILDIFEEYLIVINRVWKRAINQTELFGSFDDTWWIGPLIQQKASEAMKDMGLSIPWIISERKMKFWKESGVSVKKGEPVTKLLGLLIGSPKIFTNAQRLYFLLKGFYGGMGYFDELYESLISNILESQYLKIPPYFVLSEETNLEEMEEFHCEMTLITLSTKRYGRLRTAFQELKNDRIVLDRSNSHS
jgi:hypothetical protein